MTSTLDALSRTSDQVYDDLLLPEETVEIRADAREFAATVLAPRAAELNSAEESKAAFPRDIVDAMAAAGLYTIRFASDVGGRELQYPMLAAATVVEELAYYTPVVASALLSYPRRSPARFGVSTCWLAKTPAKQTIWSVSTASGEPVLWCGSRETSPAASSREAVA